MWVTAGMVLGLAASAAGAALATPDSSALSVNEQALRTFAQGRLLEARGEYREALGSYVRALAMDHQAVPIARRVAELVARMGDARGAIEFADRALAVDSTDARSLWVKGTALFSLGRPADALPVLEACVRSDSSQAEYLTALAHTGEALDRIDVVARAYTRAVELNPDDAESWFQLAAAQARLGRFGAADSSLAASSELSPVRPGQLFLQGWVAEGLGRDDEAIERYRGHLEVNPDDQTTRRRLVNLLARHQRWAEAWPESRRVTRSDPNDWETLIVEAEIALKAGRDARPALERLEKLSAGDVERTGGLCAMLIHNKRAPEAIRIADAWASRHPGDADGPLLAARVRGVAGQREQALPFARQAVEAAPDSLAPRLLLARLYSDTRRYDEAESTLATAVRQRPKSVGVLLELAGLREDRGDSDRAEVAARDALRLDPNNARALNFLGYLMADHNRGLDEAQRLIHRALEQDPDNGAYVDSMGWVLYRLGKFDEARTQLERAIQLTEGDPVVREHLGDAYRQLKLPERAREQYRLCLDRDGSNARVRAKLAALQP
jgi:tetratricopeptide (TPR) repeat protein